MSEEGSWNWVFISWNYWKRAIWWDPPCQKQVKQSILYHKNPEKGGNNTYKAGRSHNIWNDNLNQYQSSIYCNFYSFIWHECVDQYEGFCTRSIIHLHDLGIYSWWAAFYATKSSEEASVRVGLVLCSLGCINFWLPPIKRYHLP